MIVIDASVAIKWLLSGEKDEEKAFRLLEDHLEKKEPLTAPDLLLYEIANTLVTKVEVPAFVALRSLKSLQKANLILYHPTFDTIYEATKLSRKYKTTVYDMLYAVMAKMNNIILVTADEKFIAATKFPYVKLLSEM